MDSKQQTELYLRKILEAKEERSSISHTSKKIKTEHSQHIRDLVQQMRTKDIKCIELTTTNQKDLALPDASDKNVYLKMTDLTDREPKIMPRHVNLFAKQWFESKESCQHELQKTLTSFLGNISKHLEFYDKK